VRRAAHVSSTINSANKSEAVLFQLTFIVLHFQNMFHKFCLLMRIA